MGAEVVIGRTRPETRRAGRRKSALSVLVEAREEAAGGGALRVEVEVRDLAVGFLATGMGGGAEKVGEDESKVATRGEE